MNVSLTPELEKYVAQQVKGGLYQTASEVVRAALRQQKSNSVPQLPPTPKTLDELVNLLNERIASLDRGEGVNGKEALARFRKKIKGLHRG
jgi:putative addiction module CopG family antidote